MAEVVCPNCHKTFEIDGAGYAAIERQVRNIELERDVAKQREIFEAEKAAALEAAALRAKNELDRALSEKDSEIERLRASLDRAGDDRAHAVETAELKAQSKLAAAVSEKQAEIERLASQVARAASEQENARLKLQQEYGVEITELKSAMSAKEQASREMIEQLKAQIIEMRDMRMRLSTKMIGEDLEQHCANEFNKIRPLLADRNIKFGKDNELADGTKGDFIYRECSDDGVELISIMFEMKNEAETTATKQKNEKFFDKLDKDRRKKDCEYAVLVSMLESDSDYYNTGIVAVTDYEKMYVVRPQFFLQIISILRGAAMDKLEYKRRVAELENEQRDVKAFDTALGEFQRKLSRDQDLADRDIESALKEVGESIKRLEKVRDHLEKLQSHVAQMSSRGAALSLRALTKDAPKLAAEANGSVTVDAEFSERVPRVRAKSGGELF